MLPALSTSTSLVPLPRRFHKIGLNEILSIDQFASHLDSLELPSQLAAVLHSKWLQHYIALDPQSTQLSALFLCKTIFDLWSCRAVVKPYQSLAGFCS